MTGRGGGHRLDPDWVPEPVRGAGLPDSPGEPAHREPRDAGTPAELPAFGSPGHAARTGRGGAGGSWPEATAPGPASPDRGWLSSWQVGGLVALVLAPFLVWFLWSSLEVEQDFAADEAVPSASGTAAPWPWQGGVAPIPPRPTATYVPAPTPTMTLLQPPTLRPPTLSRPRGGPGLPPAVPPPTQFPPNLRPTPLPGVGGPKPVPTSVKTIRVEVSAPPGRAYSLSVAATGGFASFPAQRGPVVLELPARVLRPSPLQKVASLGVSTQAASGTDLLTCRVTVGGVTITQRQGRGHAACTVLSTDLGWN